MMPHIIELEINPKIPIASVITIHYITQMAKLKLEYDRNGRMHLVPVTEEKKAPPTPAPKKKSYPYADLFELKKSIPVKEWYKNHYLKSKLWENIRKKVLKRDKYRCRICGERANHVHHTEYTKRVLKGHDKHKLVSLCSECHYIIEFTPDGLKRPQKEVNTRLISVKEELEIIVRSLRQT